MGSTHVVLVRGINVGGRNAVPMAALRSALETAGLRGVRTYIQSGNVLVDAPGLTHEEVGAVVVERLATDFAVDTVVVTVTADALRATVRNAPPEFGSAPHTYHSDVAFVRAGVTTATAVKAFAVRDGVDTLWEGDGVVYFQRLSAQRTKSRLSAVMASPVYRDITIRNWATTTRLAAMLDVD